MQLPRRSIKSIQPLPSIYTAFQAQDSTDSGTNSGKCLIREIEDGIEVVPFEMRNSLSAPILSPEQGDLEVYKIWRRDAFSKPLPKRPTLWSRLDLKQRILVLIIAQFSLLLVVGLSLLAVKHRSLSSNQQPQSRGMDDNSTSVQTLSKSPSGTYAIPISSPQQQSSACLARMNESVAWQCLSDAVLLADLTVTLDTTTRTNASTITIRASPSNINVLYHGHQLPNLRSIRMQDLTTSNTDITPKDPTYYFRTTYDRAVLLLDTDLANSSTEKPRTQILATQHLALMPEETVWRCTFNETVIEGWLYTAQNTTTTPITTTTANNTNFQATTTTAPKIPHVLKIVEQRMPNGKVPYCEKMRVTSEGRLVEVGGEKKVLLGLSEPGLEPKRERRGLGWLSTVRRLVSACWAEAWWKRRYGKGGAVTNSRVWREKEGRRDAWKREQLPSDKYCKCQWMIQ